MTEYSTNLIIILLRFFFAGSTSDSGSTSGCESVAIDLSAEKYRADFTRLTPDSPVAHTRAYIHHLLHCHELLASILLCEHVSSHFYLFCLIFKYNMSEDFTNLMLLLNDYFSEPAAVPRLREGGA